MSESKYSCFIIAPFGQEGTPDRQNFERFKKFIVLKAITNVRAEISGINITVKDGLALQTAEQIPEKVKAAISDASFCIADISDENPNVYYEIGYCVALDKPLIFVAKYPDTKFPKDLGIPDCAKYDLTDLDSVDNSVDELAARIISKLPDIQKHDVDTNGTNQRTVQKQAEDIRKALDNLIDTVKNSSSSENSVLDINFARLP